ncbi:MAG: DUF354 domain-containing protein [Ignavibacteria bacterium]|jgi:predicted glycosyltransferase
MIILVDVEHPAHVHYFKNIINLLNKNNKVIVTAIQKDITLKLLEIYGINYIYLGKSFNSKLGKIWSYIRNIVKILIITIIYRPKIILSANMPSPSFVGFLLRKFVIGITDTEHAKLNHFITNPFTNIIFTPESHKTNYGKKHKYFKGYLEMTYLHPNYYKPKDDIYDLLGLRKDEKFIIMRFIAWNAVHDIGHYGLSLKIKRRAVEEFSHCGKVFISSEGKLPQDLEKYKLKIPESRIHDVLYYATLMFSESGTMSVEAAILGTPTVRVSSLAKLLGNFKELNEKYHLIEYYDSDEIGFQRAKELLNDQNSKDVWRERAKKLLDDKIDVTKFMVNFVLDRNNYG